MLPSKCLICNNDLITTSSNRASCLYKHYAYWFLLLEDIYNKNFNNYIILTEFLSFGKFEIYNDIINHEGNLNLRSQIIFCNHSLGKNNSFIIPNIRINPINKNADYIMKIINLK